MQEVKRTFRFTRDYINNVGKPASVVTEIEVDFDKKSFFIDNLTTHDFRGYATRDNLPKMIATLELQLEATNELQQLFN
jgi:hypothetical protein